MDNHTKASALGFGLVMLAQVAALVVKQLRTVGSIIGRLERSVEVPVDKINLDFQLGFFKQRLAELGFKPEADETAFIQGGADFSGVASTPHARKKKRFTLETRGPDGDKAVVRLTLRYLELVVLDTGEAAYRDAVLDYVSGETDEVAHVGNESFKNILALNSFIGGMVACAVAGLLIGFDAASFWPAIAILGVTEIAVGSLALFAVIQKRGERASPWTAVAGILLSLLAISATIFFIVNTKVSSAS